MKPFAVATMHPDAHHDMGRHETLDSLLDGRAKWPDGSVRMRDGYKPLYERARAAVTEPEFEIVMPDGGVIGPFRGPRELRLAAASLPTDGWKARVVGVEG